MNKIVFLKGGLGNQIFQFYRAYIDCSEDDKLILFGSLFDQYNPRRRFELNFLISENIVYKNCNFFSSSIFRYFLEILAKLRIITSDKGTGLFKFIYFGYFQDLIYFRRFNSEKKLRDIYQALSNKVKINISDFKNLNTGLVYHLRLSDRTNSNSVTSFIEYLTSNNLNDHEIFIFTDSPELVKPFMNSFKVQFISDLNLSLLEEFYLISSLDKVIISSSSMSVFARLISGKTIDFLPSNVNVGDKILISKFCR